MKNHLWTRAILEGYQYLKKIIRILDKQVISMSVHSYQGYQTGADATLQLMQEILELIERKKSLLRLKKIIEERLSDYPKLKHMSECAQKAGIKDDARRLADGIEKTVIRR